jgi:RTX calcium-binding nonapeptide repeat (4 copies)
MVMLAPFIPTSPALAAAISVTTTNDQFGSGAACSLREATRAANSDSAFGGCSAGNGADVISLAEGIYRLTRTGVADDDTTAGDLDVTENLTIRGLGPKLTVIDANGAVTGERALDVQADPRLSLFDLTIRHGKTFSPEFHGGGINGDAGATINLTNVDVHSNSADSNGGGIRIVDGRLVVNRSHVFGNDSGSNGGGISVDNAELVMENSRVDDNFAGSNAGGIEANEDSTATITRSSITDNSVERNGGGIFLSTNSTLDLTRSTVADNRAGRDSGGIRGLNNMTISRSTIRSNTAGATAGGILWLGNDPTVLEINNTTISGNHSEGVGGGLSLVGTGDALLTNTTISHNDSASSGGGISMDDADGETTLANVTVTRNRADSDDEDTGDGGGDGGGIFVEAGTFTLRNSIVAANTDAGGEAPDCSGALTSEDYNLLGLDTSCIAAPGSNDLIGDPTPLDPEIKPLADNGGATRTHALLPGSPAREAGNPAAPGGAAPSCAGKDQRGVPRGDCDIGAYQYVACFGLPVDHVGTPGRDVMNGTGATDVFLGLGGNDRINAGKGDDRGCGGEGRDTMLGQDGSDKLAGEDGADSLDGGSGKDTCVGGPGPDTAVSCEKKKSI